MVRSALAPRAVPADPSRARGLRRGRASGRQRARGGLPGRGRARELPGAPARRRGRAHAPARAQPRRPDARQRRRDDRDEGQRRQLAGGVRAAGERHRPRRLRATRLGPRGGTRRRRDRLRQHLAGGHAGRGRGARDGLEARREQARQLRGGLPRRAGAHRPRPGRRPADQRAASTSRSPTRRSPPGWTRTARSSAAKASAAAWTTRRA